MAQVTYRGNLSAKVFPFISEYFGPTVIIPGQDQNFSRQLSSSEDPDKDRGIPQIYYCHNVMPSAEGFQSVGYANALTDYRAGFKKVFTLRNTKGEEILFSRDSSGNNYVLHSGGTEWSTIDKISTTADVKITTATVNGQTYIYFARIGCYVYDTDISSLRQVTLIGLEPSSILGITSSAGYMVAWTDTAVSWSSTIERASEFSPIDFVPSLTTGAGGGNVEAARGKITHCFPHYLGFIIYTSDNAVAAVYSGNARYPFNMREIVNSGGVNDESFISFDSSSGNHYAYTTSGLQLVSITQTQTVFPEVTDFIAGAYFEDFDESTLSFTRKELRAALKKAINVISDRYLIISYGITSLTHALVFDIAQKRFGKLKINHVSCFEWKPVGSSVEVPRRSIGFLQMDGSIKVVDFNYTSANSKGVMVLGKYQLARSRLAQLQEVSVENVRDSSKFALYNLVSYDGKTLQPPVPGTLAEDYGPVKKYNFHQTGLNHTLLAIGSFYCSAIVLKLNVHGRR